MSMFAVRVVCVDSYQAPPLVPYDCKFSEFRNSNIKNVPTIRIFGSTLSDEKVCLHIHGVFPYIYVPYVGGEDAEVLAHRLADALDSAINISLGYARANTQHVYKIQQVKGVPFYGYHEKEHHFLKIYFYNPPMAKKAAELLQNGSILNQSLQPHEAHIPFILQFMIDYNVYGMSLINLKDVKHRQKNRRGADGRLIENVTPHLDTRDYLPPTVKRQSVCEIEADAWASDIQYETFIEHSKDANPGLIAIWKEEKARRILAGFEGGVSQLLPPSSPPRQTIKSTKSDQLQLEKFQRKLISVSQSTENSSSNESLPSFYPIEADERYNLLDASHIEQHIGQRKDGEKRNQFIEKKSKSFDSSMSSKDNSSLDLKRNPMEESDTKNEERSVKMTFADHDKNADGIIFDSGDISLVNILEQLAEEHEDREIDEDSILGSFCSGIIDDYKSSEENEEDCENPDLNLTTIEINSLSLNPSLTPISSNVPKNNSFDEEKPEMLSLSNFISPDSPNFFTPTELSSDNKVLSQKEEGEFSAIPQLDGADDSPENTSSRREKKRKRINVNEDSGDQIFNSRKDKSIKSETSEDSTKIFESTSDCLLTYNELDCTFIADSEAKFSQAKSTLSGTSGSLEKSFVNSDLNRTFEVTEKLICKYKGHENQIANDFWRQARRSVLESPSKNPRSTRSSPEKALNSPSKVSQSPRKSIKSPRRNYSSLCITVTPFKKHSVSAKHQIHNITREKNSNEDASSSGKSSFTQQHMTERKFQSDGLKSEIPLHDESKNEQSYADDIIRLFLSKESQDNENQGRTRLSLLDNNKFSSDGNSGSKTSKDVSEKSAGIRSNNLLENIDENFEQDQATSSSDSENDLRLSLHDLTSKNSKGSPILSSEWKNETKMFDILDISREIKDKISKLTDISTINDSQTNLTSRESGMRLFLCRGKNQLITIITKFSAPSRQDIIESMQRYGIPSHRNQEPFYSDYRDIQTRKDMAHQIINEKDFSSISSFKSQIEGIAGIKSWRKMKLNEFHTQSTKLVSLNVKKSLAERRLIMITPLLLPPDNHDIINWLRNIKLTKHREGRDNNKGKYDIEIVKSKRKSEEVKIVNVLSSESVRDKSHIELNRVSRREKSEESSGNDSTFNETLKSSENELWTAGNKKGKKLELISIGQVDFSMDETKNLSDIAARNLQNAKAITSYQYLTILCLEVYVNTRKDLLPDPQHDSIKAVFYSIHNDVPPTSTIKRLEEGVILVDIDKSSSIQGLYASCKFTYANCEEDLFCKLISLIIESDPDIFIGWEVETLSWGYIFQRAAQLGTNLATIISRIPGSNCKWEFQPVDSEDLTEIKLPGRIVLDVWRIMRHEIALLSYSFENVMYHVLHQRLPCPSFRTLTEWWNSKRPCLRWRVFDYYIKRVSGTMKLIDQLDIVGRTSEHARLFGIQFYEVFSRGSQFRVESMMMRLTKSMNYILVSPSISQRAAMRAPEALPLIMEPISTFYSDPVVVLDFQSLYPSIIIAYNYCYSTCLGRIELMGQNDPFEFGCTTLKITKKTIMKYRNSVNFSPVGVGFLKREIREGVLPRMLSEILNTRLMVKKAIKDHPKDDRALQQVLHNRQLGLKLIANVTYGYTSANFSGRMPCIEIGDSIVSKAKETLERAIKLVEDTAKWGARVIYGDTDSLFILLTGKSKKDAFKIGAEIADAVTAVNPTPVKLKFEKVLYPSILQTKKRYCGYSFESPENEKPEYLAKGIETVRRDGCPAVAKILEKSLKILFDTKDISLVKQYVTRQLYKVCRGIISIQDLTFAREFRGLRGYKKNACVPALELTRRLIKRDPRAIPRTSERVRYIIVAGAPNEALIHSVRSPSELLADPSLRPNALYYITRVIIPPLNRCLLLLGADVNIW